MAHDTPRHLVVDGSNIATESRTAPSLVQLDEAVRAMIAEQPEWQITVIVDATFGHRIDSKERKAYEEASDNGEIVTPPAGAVGRGDAFILQVAEKAEAAVLSNDSFQEFHGQHPWLFDEGRLIGGKPVEGIGWVFVPRVPVRGPTSRSATREAKERSGDSKKRTSSKSTKRTSARQRSGDSAKKPTKSSAKTSRRSQSSTSEPRPVPTANTPPPRASKKDRDEKSQQKAPQKSSRPSPKQKKVTELNSPIDFLGFVGKHSIGDQVEAVVERFSSHGCYVRSSGAQCYLPLAAMGEPQASRARDVVSDGQPVIVKVESIDSDRRGINVTLVRVIDSEPGSIGRSKSAAKRSSRGAGSSTTSQKVGVESDDSAGEANPTRSDTTVATKKSPAKATASKRATRASARKATKKAAKRAPAKKAVKKAVKKTAKKAPAKKAVKKTAKKAVKKTTKKAPAKKAVKKTTKKAPAKKAVKKAVKKTTKKAPAKKAVKKAVKKTAKKAPAKKAVKKTAKKAPAKKAVKKTTKKAVKKTTRR